ncbi:MAG: enoyl-CoA hydratase/isomerase family protein [Deltaproteobacteria bacterium]|nr:enoyl-CoA hydratase/isomerase family protein [Deltaproteobacteria bacterium]MBW2658934.1 enoyl-CoA hydratase/isomerase family protein [Deltaproteobacteria bacterium]
MQWDNIEKNVEGGIATVTINRPKALNALNYDTLKEMLACFIEIGESRDVHVVIITGSGEKAFVAGADISFMEKLDPLSARQFGKLGHEVLNTIENLPQPVIAAINGFALGGGCEMALACDMRLASDRAKFGQPEVNLGVIPGFGGTQRLPRLVGKGHANELVFSGKIIDADEAGRIGLVNRVVPHEQLLEECLILARMISAKSPVAVRLCKESVNNGVEMDLDRACEYEVDLFSLCFAASDQKEGMKAFLEKRAPQFKGE